MILKSFGCSFIYGTDLADDGRGREIANPSKLTWPSLIARQLGLSYACYARPGSGNFRILERVLTQAASNERDLFVIGWTWIDRFDYTDTNDKWQTLMPIDTGSVARVYYRDLHSQFRDKLSSLTAIKLAIDTLQQKQIPFFMTYMDELILEDQWHATPAITDLQQQIKPYLNRFEGHNFLEWSKKKGFPISETQHPLEPAHKAAADLMRPNFSHFLV